MKFYYLEDINNEIFTEYDIQVLHIPQLTKKHILWALQDISMIVNSKINIPELYND